MEKEREGKDFQNGCNYQELAWLKQGARISTWVPDMNCRDPSTWTASAAFPDVSSEVDGKQYSDRGWQCHTQWHNPV